MPDSKKLVLIDGMALAYRGHFAFIRNPRITSKKLNASSIFVFANTILQLLEQEQPTHFAVVFDTKEPTHRHTEYPEYKATRESMPEDLSEAIPYLDRLCEAFRIPVLRSPGWEADDVVGTLALIADREGYETLMVTPDKDYAQLVSDTSVLIRPAKSGGFDRLGKEEVLEEWGIERIDQVIDILGLMGDSSDNIPGVPGIGKKTAQKLIAEFGTVESLLENADKVPGKRGESLVEFRDQALLSKRLVTIDRDAPIQSQIDDLAVKEIDEPAAKELFAELEFNTISKRLFGEGAGETTELRQKLMTIEDIFHTYRVADDKETRGALIDALLQQERVCFDSETTGLDARSCELVGLSFSWQPHEGWYVPFPQDQDESAAILAEFTPFFTHQGIEKIAHNLKFDLSVLRWKGVEVSGPFFDTMIAAGLLMPDQKLTMDALSEALLSYKPVDIHALIGEDGNMRDVPIDQIKDYASEDADVTLRLSEELRPKLADEGLERVFMEVESPLTPVLVDMEFQGIRLASGTLEELSDEFSKDIVEYEQSIKELAGEEFNVASPKQLGEILFDKMKLDDKAKRTSKSGQYSTSEQVLRRLAGRHEIAQKILDFRKLSKLKSTYLDMLPTTVRPDTGRVHTYYEQMVTATGRLQSHDPNLQNIPIRTEQGKEIRKAFVAADDDHLILSADYSQIELRIAAEMSGDESLIAAFESGLDIHTATAMKMFDVEQLFVNGDMRRRAKTVNFGILYGISAFGLSERLGIPRFEAADLIESYYDGFGKLKAWQDRTVEFAKEHGYVETLTGRRRYLRDINSRNRTVRMGAERNAINTPIQGTAADLIKLAMSAIWTRMREENLTSRMLLQVHDELVFDMKKSEEKELKALVQDCMCNAIKMRVPIAVDMGQGENWLDAH